MSFEWLETDFGIKSYCHSTVFVFPTGNLVPNQLFTGSTVVIAHTAYCIGMAACSHAFRTLIRYVQATYNIKQAAAVRRAHGRVNQSL
jgi:hypothetical protein